MKKVFSLLLALLVLVSLAVPAFATTVPSDSTILIKSKSLFDFNVESKYTSSDLFDEFKDIMPGDTLTEKVTIVNQSRSTDYVKVYLKAVLHDEDSVVGGNHLKYSETYENTDGKDQAGISGKRDETVATMSQFLSKLTMTVTDKSGKVIFEGAPSELDGLEKRVSLGKLRKNKSLELNVKLYWYPDANYDEDETNDYDYNDYANRVGEVDWVFTVEHYNDSSDTPKTGDYIILGAVALMAVSGAALLILLIIKRRKNRK